jgi:transcriptional regulator with XRE-family HTH domain
MTETNDPPVIIGKRLRILRRLAGLTIAEFAALADVSSPSVSYWENGQINSPIKPKSMVRVLNGLSKVGIDVSERWLRRGEGSLPTYQGEMIVVPQHENGPEPAPDQIVDVSTQLAAILADEIKLFTSVSHAVITKVDHDALSPFLAHGDLVGGIWQPASNLTEETVCIFRLNNKLQVHCLKPDSADITALEKIAPVLRVWRLTI